MENARSGEPARADCFKTRDRNTVVPSMSVCAKDLFLRATQARSWLLDTRGKSERQPHA
jgi:hypothetical protein